MDDVVLSLRFRMGVLEEETPVLLIVGVTLDETTGESLEGEFSEYFEFTEEGATDVL